MGREKVVLSKVSQQPALVLGKLRTGGILDVGSLLTKGPQVSGELRLMTASTPSSEIVSTTNSAFHRLCLYQVSGVKCINETHDKNKITILQVTL